MATPAALDLSRPTTSKPNQVALKAKCGTESCGNELSVPIEWSGILFAPGSPDLPSPSGFPAVSGMARANIELSCPRCTGKVTLPLVWSGTLRVKGVDAERRIILPEFVPPSSLRMPG